MRKFLPLLLLLIAAALAYLAYDRFAGLRVTAFSPGGEEVSPLANVRLEFSTAVDPASVERAFQIEPAIQGAWSWEGQAGSFTHARPFEPGQTYQVSLREGVSGPGGRQFGGQRSWSFTVRTPRIAYLAPVFGAREVWSMPAGGGSPLQLTQTGGAVLDFSPSRSGDTIAYTRRNGQGGADLWQMARDGSKAVLLAACGEVICSGPAWTPDGQTLAYLRIQPPLSGADQSGEVWLLDMTPGASFATRPLAEYTGSQLNWSPDGTRLALLDPIQKVVRVVSLGSDPEVQLPGGEGGGFAWLPDGNQIAALEPLAGQDVQYNRVLIYNFTTHTANPLPGELGETDLSLPAWAPDGSMFAAALRVPGSIPAAQLWVFSADGKPAAAVLRDPGYHPSAYSWDPWSRELLFLRIPGGAAQPPPEVMLWARDSGTQRSLAVDATRPTWVP